MKHNHFTILIILLLCSGEVVAQQANPDTLASQVEALKKDVGILKRIRVSGYLQPQFQVADSAGQPTYAGSNFAPGQNMRFTVRRARVKIQYNSAPNSNGISISQFTFQSELTEKGIALKEAYAKITDPWKGWFSLQAGMFDNPFGFECPYSSGLRESPERGRMSQLHFPNESEVGAMFTVQAPKSSKVHGLRWDIAMVNGIGGPSTGVDVSDFDSKKDLTTRLSYAGSLNSDKLMFGIGVSYYDGGYRIDSANVYKSDVDANGTRGFVLESSAEDNGAIAIAERGYTTRQYYGIDAQVSLKWVAGTTTLRGEYIAGEQPGIATSSKSPNDKNPITKDSYGRPFDGAYFYFLQNIMKSPFQLVVKYDWYDANTDVKGDDLGKAMTGSGKATSETDLRYDTWGLGLNYAFDSNIRIMAYYDMVTNETSKNLKGFENDRPDDVFTLRLQVRF